MNALNRNTAQGQILGKLVVINSKPRKQCAKPNGQNLHRLPFNEFARLARFQVSE